MKIPLQRIALPLAVCCFAHLADAADAPVEPVTVKAVARFGFDRTTLLPADRDRILAEVAKMKDVTWQTVTTTGHTDALGRPVYNEALSLRRAEAVKAYLIGKGLQPGMIGTAGRGAAQPLADNGSAAGRARNRRAEIVFEGVRPVAK